MSPKTRGVAVSVASIVFVISDSATLYGQGQSAKRLELILAARSAVKLSVDQIEKLQKRQTTTSREAKRAEEMRLESTALLRQRPLDVDRIKVLADQIDFMGKNQDKSLAENLHAILSPEQLFAVTQTDGPVGVPVELTSFQRKQNCWWECSSIVCRREDHTWGKLFLRNLPSGVYRRSRSVSWVPGPFPSRILTELGA